MLPGFNKFVSSSDPQVRSHPLLLGPTHSNRNWEAGSTPPLFISAHSGNFRYRNSPRVHWMTSMSPFPVYTRALNWRAEFPGWLRVKKEPFPVCDPHHIWIRDPRNPEARSLIYTLAPWVPYATTRAQLPFEVPKEGAKLLRSPDRKPGLLDATRRTARVREFGLPEALTYSHLLDTRFILFACLLVGFSAWCFSVPE